MRRSLNALSLFLALSATTAAFAKEVYFPIAGSATNIGSFKTDVRVFNPSSTKDITIQAFLLAAGLRDNSNVTARTINVPKRQMVALNDVVTALGGTDLNAIRLTSPDDFVATERVFAVQTPNGTCNIAGTFGQDIPPLEVSAAKKNGVLLHLKMTGGNCTQAGTMSFRTNLGVVNPNTVAASVTFRLYDKNNVLVSTGNAITIPPMGVIAPTNLASGLFFHPGGFDLTDAWVSFTSTQPLLSYASLVDNCSNDPTFIGMAEDAVTGSASTKELYFPTTASTTDVRLFNPSATKDITVQAYVLPSGNINNSGVAPRSITVPKRQMVVINDAIDTFGGSGINSLRLTSADDFIATERVYSQRTPGTACNLAGTIGHDVTALRPSSAKKQGVLLQLKATTGVGPTPGPCFGGVPNFRTDIGLVNPNGTAAKTTFRLYDKNNALVATGEEITVPPMGVIAPTSLTTAFFVPPNTDLSDAWVSYTSDQPLLAYASVIDTCTTDPTYIPMAEDTGASTPAPSAKSFTVTLVDFAIQWTPTPAGSVVRGDVITVTITGGNSKHGFELQDPDGQRLISLATVNAGQSIVREITISKDGTYNYFCTQPACDTGSGRHADMFGQFVVGQDGEPPRGPGY